MMAIHPWHVLLLGCLCLVVVLIVVGIVLVVRATSRR
jgi:hypothetical protein